MSSDEESPPNIRVTPALAYALLYLLEHYQVPQRCHALALSTSSGRDRNGSARTLQNLYEKGYVSRTTESRNVMRDRGSSKARHFFQLTEDGLVLAARVIDQYGGAEAVKFLKGMDR